MDPPTVPEGFLQLCIKYEYFKRNCTQQANENVCEMINRLGRYGDLQFPDTKEEYKEYPKSFETPKEKPSESDQKPGTSSEEPPPKKRKTENVEEDKEESDPEEAVPDSDPDSDDYEIILSDAEDGKESGVDVHGILKKAKWLYKRFSEKELEECEYYYPGWDLIDYMKLIPIQRIVNTSNIPVMVNKKPKHLEILIGYRKILVRIGQNEKDNKAETWLNFTYMSSEKGCLVWYGDTVWIEKTLKYQSLAAKEFFYLMRGPEVRLKSLKIDIEDYNKWNRAIWPFSLFQQKIAKYMATRDLKLKVEFLCLKIFNKYGRTRNGQKYLKTIWEILDPEVLRIVKFRLWNDSDAMKRRGMRAPDGEDLLSVLYRTEQWKKVNQIDIIDDFLGIEEYAYPEFLHFEVVSTKLEQSQFAPLIRASFNHKRPGLCNFYVNDEFDFPQAAKMFGKELKGLLNPNNEGLYKDDAAKKILVIPRVLKSFRCTNGVTVSLSQNEKKITVDTMSVRNN